MEMVAAYIYIITNKAFGTLYIGMTNDLMRRIWEHKHKMVEGFSSRYELNRLVYYETHASTEAAALREKQLKEWRRNWKIELIMKTNPEWNDLYNDFVHAVDLDPGFRRDCRI